MQRLSVKLANGIITGTLVLSALSFSPKVFEKDVHAASVENQSFKDVTATYWAHKEITFLLEKGIIELTRDGYFLPNQDITRKETAKMLAKALNLETSNLPNPNYPDVPKTDPYYPYIAAVTERGLFSGKDNGEFDPNGTLTRSQMAKVLVIAYDMKPLTGKEFPDVLGTHWAHAFVKALSANEITTGSNGLFKPQSNLSKAQLSTFLYRSIQKFGEKTEEPVIVPNPTPLPPVEPPTPPVEGELTLQETLNQYTFLFEEEIPEIWEEQYEAIPISKIILKDGLSILENTTLKYKYTTTKKFETAMSFATPGYKSPITHRQDFELAFSGRPGQDYLIQFDQRNEELYSIVEAWVRLVTPHMDENELESFIDSIYSKAVEAVNVEKEGGSLRSNYTNHNVYGDYSINYGVNGYFEHFVIDVSYQGEK